MPQIHLPPFESLCGALMQPNVLRSALAPVNMARQTFLSLRAWQREHGESASFSNASARKDFRFSVLTSSFELLPLANSTVVGVAFVNIGMKSYGKSGYRRHSFGASPPLCTNALLVCLPCECQCFASMSRPGFSLPFRESKTYIV